MSDGIGVLVGVRVNVGGMVVGVGNKATDGGEGYSNTMIAPNKMMISIKIDNNNNIGDRFSINSDSITNGASILDFAALSSSPANVLSVVSFSSWGCSTLSSDEEKFDNDDGKDRPNLAPHIRHWLASGSTTLSQFGQRRESFSWGDSTGVTSDPLVI